ncbi:MFS transporter [Paenibacillus dendritiformis]|uniref:MFS transporter n=1 Tax=Paenibacillus dendritiformis TaxID=130049 RepID=UPI00143E07AF|nr:MFS transporter [Paenibacillus dendritiformis]NKI22109.1 MFS transporter [Paenibacillus dendritiformis]NRF98702.1 MFS transporter [Paenibacillus dendritiformis]
MSEARRKYNGPLVILMMNMFVTMVGMGLIIPILPSFLQEFGGGGQAMGYLVAAFGLTQFLFSPIAGEWSDKYGRKILIVSGVGIFALSQIVFALADQMWMLYLSRLLGGLGAALLTSPMMAYIADITTVDERAKGMGLFGASMTLGVVIGPGIGGLLAEYGIRVPFYFAAGLAVAGTLLSLIFLPETLPPEKRIAIQQSKNGPRSTMVQQFLASFKAPYFVLLALVFTMSFGLQNFESIFGLYFDGKLGFTPKQISLIITFGALIGVIVQAVLIERLLRRFGEKKVLHACFILAGASMVVTLFVRQFAAIFAVTLLFFAATAIIRPALNTLLSKMAGNEQGFVAGMNTAYMSLGNIIGPSIAGILYDVNTNIPYVFGAATLLLSTMILANWKRTGKGEVPSSTASM